jgi:hypothetical protein
MLLGGAKGHLAMFDWQHSRLECEVQVGRPPPLPPAEARRLPSAPTGIIAPPRHPATSPHTPPPPRPPRQVAESTYDVQFLHNELFFAAAQRKYVYIYDKRGVEVHCLRDHTDARRLQFLPHHFLLASIGETGGRRLRRRPCAAHPARKAAPFGRMGGLGLACARVCMRPARAGCGPGTQPRGRPLPAPQARCATRTRARGRSWRSTRRG